jgi:hypothetical protein
MSWQLALGKIIDQFQEFPAGKSRKFGTKFLIYPLDI